MKKIMFKRSTLKILLILTVFTLSYLLNITPAIQASNPDIDTLVRRLAEKESWLAELKQYEKDVHGSLYGNGEDKRGLAVDQIGNRIAEQWGIDTDAEGKNFGRLLDDYEKDWAGRQADWLKKHNEFMREELNSTREEIKVVEADVAEQRDGLKNLGINNVDGLLKEERQRNPELKDPAAILSPGFLAKLKEDFLNAANNSANINQFIKESLTHVQTPKPEDRPTQLTEADGSQHRFNSQGAPEVFDPQTGEWKPEYPSATALSSPLEKPPASVDPAQTYYAQKSSKTVSDAAQTISNPGGGLNDQEESGSCEGKIEEQTPPPQTISKSGVDRSAYEEDITQLNRLPSPTSGSGRVAEGIKRSASDLPYVNEGNELVVPNGRDIPSNKIPEGAMMSEDELKTVVIPSDRYVKMETDENGVTTYLLSNGGLVKSDGSSNFDLATEGSSAQSLYQSLAEGKDLRTWGEYLNPLGPTLQQKIDELKNQVRSEYQQAAERRQAANEEFTRIMEQSEEDNPERNNMYNSDNLPRGFTVNEQKADLVEAKREELAFLTDSLIRNNGELGSLSESLGKKDNDYLSIAREINSKPESEWTPEEQKFLDKFSDTTDTAIRATDIKMELYPEDLEKLRGESLGWNEIRSSLDYRDYEPIKDLVEVTGMYKGSPCGGDRSADIEGAPEPKPLPPFPSPAIGTGGFEELDGSPNSNIAGYWSAYSDEGEVIGGGYITHDKSTGEVNAVAVPQPFDASVDRRSTWETWAPSILGGKTIEQKNAEVEAARNEAIEKQRVVAKETYEQALNESGPPPQISPGQLTTTKDDLSSSPCQGETTPTPVDRSQWQKTVDIDNPPPGSIVDRTSDLTGTGEREGSCSGDRTEQFDSFWDRPREKYSPTPETTGQTAIKSQLPPKPEQPSQTDSLKSTSPYMDNFVRPVPVDPAPPNGTLEKPYELTDEAIAKIFSFDSENNKISLAEDWKDKLGGIGGRDIHIKMSDEQIADALERQGKMTKEEKEKFAKSGKTEVPDGTPVIDPKTNKEGAPDRDNQPDKTRGIYSDEYIIRS